MQLMVGSQEEAFKVAKEAAANAVAQTRWREAQGGRYLQLHRAQQALWRNALAKRSLPLQEAVGADVP